MVATGGGGALEAERDAPGGPAIGDGDGAILPGNDSNFEACFDLLSAAFFFEFFFELAVGSGEFFAFLGNIIADLDC